MVESTPEQTPRPTWAQRQAERRTARLARQIGAFSRAHGGGAEAQVAYLGERGARIVLVAENGDWGDLVAPSHAMALEAVERSGIPLHQDFAGELAARVRTGRYEWSRMAGIQIGGHANP